MRLIGCRVCLGSELENILLIIVPIIYMYNVLVPCYMNILVPWYKCNVLVPQGRKKIKNKESKCKDGPHFEIKKSTHTDPVAGLVKVKIQAPT